MGGTLSPSSRAFEHGGLYILRSQAFYLLAVCHQIGVRNTGPHKHNDWLSFELCVNDRPAIIDPGTYCYTSQPEIKALFRSTSYHNTVVVDRAEQHPHGASSFALDKPHGGVRVVRWVSDDSRDLLEAEHTGYTRLRDPVVHSRRFELDKERDCLEIVDSFTGSCVHTMEWFLHLAVGQTSRQVGSRLVILDGANALLAVMPPAGCAVAVRKVWVSTRYNHRSEAECLSWLVQTIPGRSGPFRIKFTVPADV